jgi:Ca-activated chloride channel homolog
MNDDLDRLKAALQAAMPQADAQAKARALAEAQKTFETLQGSPAPGRPTLNRPHFVARIWRGAKIMTSRFTLRPALYATSFLVVAGFAFVLVKPYDPASPLLTQETKPLADTARSRAAKTESEKDDVATTRPLATTPQAAAPVKPTAEPIVGLAEMEMDVPSPSILATPAPMTMRADGALSRVVSEQADGYLGGVAQQDAVALPAQSRDRFQGAKPNPLKITSAEPVSTFSIDVDTASYAYVRAAILDGYLPPADAVRIEEMVNYFPYDYAAPDLDKAPFSTQVTTFQTPWNPDTKLVHIGIQGAKPALDDRPPLNLVFLIDTSGSMQDANKLPLLKQSFRLLITKLRPEDKVAIVTYAGSAGTVLEPTSAAQTGKILASLSRLEAGGSTAGQAGLQQAYGLATDMAQDGRIGRVILATDGDFNVGISDPDALKSYIGDKRESGIYLSVLGFGRGNYNDALMQSLAQNGNGTAAYIDTLAEAQKVLVDQVAGALFPIANDVKIQVEFNPATVAEYRLIGYETRILAREDFNNDKVDAGEIGAGHTVTALYEITPVGSPAIKNDPLRYQAQTSGGKASDELGYLKLRYKEPGSDTSTLISTQIGLNDMQAGQEAGFAAAVAGFGQLLTGGKYLGVWGYDDAIELATKTKGADPFGYRAEAIRLMTLAKSIQ